jgi:hypothetical protein
MYMYMKIMTSGNLAFYCVNRGLNNYLEMREVETSRLSLDRL